MRTKDLKLAERLINQAMNETIQMWSDQPERLSDYAWGYRYVGNGDGFSVGNNHGDTFFYAGEVIDIARVCGCSYYLDTHLNEEGELTPCVHVY